MDVKSNEFWIEFNANYLSIEELKHNGYKILGVTDKWILCTIKGVF